MAAILNLAILDSAILHNKNFSHSFWLNLMMAASLNPAMLDSDTANLDSDTILSFHRFIHKHSHSNLTLTQEFNLTQTHSCSLNLMMAAILNSAILYSAILVFTLKLTHTCQHWFQPLAHKKTSLIHSDSIWWRQPSWILPCWIQTLPSWIQKPCYHLSDSLKNTLTPLWLWIKLIQYDSNSFLLCNLIMAAIFNSGHLGYCHLAVGHFAQNSDSH